jgi:hypothetical protein
MNDIKQGDFTIDKCRLEQLSNGGWVISLGGNYTGEAPLQIAAFEGTPSLIAYLTNKLNK